MKTPVDNCGNGDAGEVARGKQPSVFIQPKPTAVKVKRLKFFIAIKIMKAGGGPGVRGPGGGSEEVIFRLTKTGGRVFRTSGFSDAGLNLICDY